MRYIMVCLILAGMTSANASAQPTPPQRSYDQSGHFTGRSERIGNTIRYYDAEGHFVGRDVIESGGISHYDAEGHFLGKTTR